MVISGYFVTRYWWLLMAITLVDIGGYWWLFCCKPLVVIDGYFINGY